MFSIFFDQFDMLCFEHVTHEYHEVIHINDKEALMHFIGEHIVHHLLEHARAIAHSKEYHNWLISSDGCDKGSFPLVTTFDAHIVISLIKVHLCVHITPLELVDQLRDKWQRVVIMDGTFIQISVVGHHTLLTILLGYEKHQ